MSLLRYSADRRSIGSLAVHLTLLASAFVFVPRGLGALALSAAIAYSAFIQLISGHNAIHSPIFRHRTLNHAWQMALSLGFGYPSSAFVPVHNLSHHMNLQTAKDVLRTTEVRHRNNLLNLLHHVVMGTAHIHVLSFAYMRVMRRRRPVWFAQVRREIAAVVTLIVVLLAINPLAFVEFALLPYLFAQCMIIGFGYVQHDGTDEKSDYNHSRNFTGALFNWLIFDNGYHTIHHNRPGLHWSLTRAAHRREIVPHMHAALNRHSVLAYMWRAYVAPGVRERFDGRPVVLPPQRTRRELWIPLGALLPGEAVGRGKDGVGDATLASASSV